jgi:hypothetical protein
LYQQAETYKEKPSQVFGIRDNRWLGWQFDQAVLTWGRYVDNKLAEKDKEGKPKHKLSRLLGIKPRPQPVNIGQLTAARGGLLLKE